MKTMLAIAASLLLAVPAAAGSDPVQQSSSSAGQQGSSQATQPTTSPADCLQGMKMDILNDFKKPVTDPVKDPLGPKPYIMREGTADLTPYLCYGGIQAQEQPALESFRAKLLASYEQSRQDKQPGATSNSSGTTSLVSKGSSPSLIGLAIEHGGLTQTTDGNTITFRGNVANSIRALIAGTYLGAYQLGEKDPLIQGLAKLSFGISFDTSANQPSSSQGFTPSASGFSGFSAKYEIYNHRDPRYKEYRAQWDGLEKSAGNALAKAIGQVLAPYKEDCKKAPTASAPAGSPPTAAPAAHTICDWKNAFEDDLDELLKKTAPPSDADVEKLLEDSANRFKLWFTDAPATEKQARALANAGLALSTFADDEAIIITKIKSTPMVTLEYNYNRQLTTNDNNIAATQPGQKIPSLSNINLVYEQGFGAGGAKMLELTVNGGLALFDSSASTVPRRGSVRDYQASFELDQPLNEIRGIGSPTLSLAGQFLALLEEPLGQKVMVNGVTITRTGDIGVIQAKLSLPVKGSGVKIPISVSWANRTELIKEKDVRGQLGITFDFDSLFSASQ